ncbi:MAG: hypothetical protein ACRBN8_41750 [Nannocystales bacterium]
MSSSSGLKIEETPITTYMVRVAYWVAMVLIASFISRDIAVHCERGESSFCHATVRSAFMTLSERTVDLENIKGVVYTEEETTTTHDNGFSLSRTSTSVVIEVDGMEPDIDLQDHSFIGSKDVKYEAGQDLVNFLGDAEATSLDFEYGDPFYFSSLMVLVLVGGLLYKLWIHDYGVWSFEVEVVGGGDEIRMTSTKGGFDHWSDVPSEGAVALVAEDGHGRIAARYADGRMQHLCEPGWSKKRRTRVVAEAGKYLRNLGRLP